MILSFDSLDKSYGQTVALRGVTFDVPAGEIFGLLGPNGAGKSTLIRVLMDIIRPDAGTVRVFGEPRRREHLDRLGYLPEERGLYTKLRVIDVLTYFGALKGLARTDARRRALEWLERVELAHVSTWKVDRLSKGMSQKVQIAGALLSDPELCVLDEPTTGLDPVNVRLIQDLLVERRRNGRSTILSTHHMNQVEALCDRVALINKGQLMVYGAVDEVRRRYSLPEVRIHARDPLPAVPHAASIVQRVGHGLARHAGEWRRAVGAAGRARRRRRAHRPLRADARADGRHFPARRPGGPRMIRWDKVRTVAIFELTSAIRRTGFLVVTFGMPIFMAAYGAIVAVPAYYAGKRDRARPSVFGVVDRPQLLHLHADASPPKGEIDSDARRLLEQTGQSGAVDRMLPRSSFVFRPFAGEAEARASLARRDLRGYFVLTDGYLQTGIVEAYATDGFNVSQSDARNAFGVLVRQELLRGQVAPGIAARVTTPLPDVRRFAVSRNGELKDGGEAASAVRFALPLAFTVLFLMSVLMTSGYLLQGTATEKENKVVEVLLASANPDEILAGKLAGLGADRPRAGRRLDVDAVRHRLRRSAVPVRRARRPAVAGPACRAAVLHRGVPVLRQPDAGARGRSGRTCARRSSCR